MAAPPVNTSQSCHILDFTFRNGTKLPLLKLSYLDINPQNSKTALVITAFRGRLHSTCTFSNGALRNHRIIVAALLGNGESASPSNTHGFPSSIDYVDCVRLQHKLLTAHLNIHSVDVVLGFSMGGQCGYYWTLMYPEFMHKAVIICSSAKTSRHNHQFLEGPKAALVNSMDFDNASLSLIPHEPSRGLHAFGKAYSAWLTSAEWFEEEMYQSLGFKTLGDWDHTATKINYIGWGSGDLLAMLDMWQNGDVTKISSLGAGGLATTLSLIKARVLLMPCRTDQYFRWESSEKEYKMIPSASLRVIPSIWGHLAGCGINPEDTDWMDRNIAEFCNTMI